MTEPIPGPIRDVRWTVRTVGSEVVKIVTMETSTVVSPHAHEDLLICRSWTGSARESSSEAYLRHLRQAVVPQLSGIEGFERIEIMRRPSAGRVEYRVQTFWQSIESIHRFAGADTDAAVVPPEAQALLVEWDDRVKHFEIV